ncbi:hypothetical protein OG785_09970 [Streptomyces sp. NBC_00006]|uniref:hypothetical protein n=1 Tax=Streptomyces sp. NBC_00006 TaxID=2975619 RepID=UPI00225AE1EE|nr:hypothetical protein [Streptomyces sp. NBC_00006]MCX5530884.1 hypothetical protein [Streptomyces sp. NBC_00006]
MSARRLPEVGSALPADALGLLQVRAVHLAEVPGLAEAARAIGVDRGIDYLADREVAAMLHRHRRLLGRMNSRGAWGGLLLVPGAVGAWFLIDTTDWGTLDPVVGLILCSPVVLLLAAGVYLLSRAFWFRRAWVRGGTRDQVNGYLQILSTSGLALRQLPAWLKPPTGNSWR